jgi:hypothetical protein
VPSARRIADARPDLAVDFGDADRVGPMHQPTAVARKAKAVEPHHINVAGAGLALFEDLAGLVDRRKREPRRIFSSVKLFCGMPSSPTFSLIRRASSGSGCGRPSHRGTTRPLFRLFYQVEIRRHQILSWKSVTRSQLPMPTTLP